MKIGIFHPKIPHSLRAHAIPIIQSSLSLSKDCGANIKNKKPMRRMI